ncbi:MAG: tyrosine-type recombinase/integrase [Pseudolabrys sp.]|nr:tyrosine-type recombinase/integrase [Pseudolabrys sp.]MCW5696140.1 tyrosine-type recombinase/integrase [Bauldia sp.]
MHSRLPLAPLRNTSLVIAADDVTRRRFIEFFTARIRNPNTRRAYRRAVGEFLLWCEAAGIASITAVEPVHVATYIEELTETRSAPTAKARLAAIRHLFDWFVTGHVVAVNPALSVRGPSHVVRSGRTPVLTPAEARQLLDAIDAGSVAGLRDRALIGIMVYSFARIGAALRMDVDDLFIQNRRLWARLLEKGGKRHEMPCHHNLEAYLQEYVDRCGLTADPNAPLFQTIDRKTKRLSGRSMCQSDAWQMVQRRATDAGIATKIGNHTFRATGITAYLKNGGTLERAAAMANHSSTRTTQLYDRRRDEVSLDEVERVLI